jgi:hypothetical protein
MSQENVEQGGAPAWLFSFVDLAFLMLIAMTLVAAENAAAPDLGEMAVPRIGEKASKELGAGTAGEFWQVRVHPPSQYEDGSLEPPFELKLGSGVALGDEAEMLDKDDLRTRLETIHARGSQKPLLAPHEDSRSQDLLDAAALIEEYWPSPRRALVARLLEER